MDNAFFLSAQDIQKLKRFLEFEAKNIGRKPHDEQGESPNQPADVYVAVPPCGQGIPARSGSIPGQQTCCIFKLVLKTGTSSAIENLLYELIPVNQPGTGQPSQQTVYNIYDTAVPALLPPNEVYIRVEKDRYGKWFSEPWNYPITSTTSTTTTTPCNGVCQGYCEWTWNGTCWNQGSNTCGNSYSVTSTTPSPCLCNTAGTSSTTSTTTTTTWCKYCFYPNFNGLTTGQCTYTYCSREQSPAILTGVEICNTTSTTSTTTTSVNCNTTSTTSQCSSGCSSNCTGNCVWAWQNGQWVLICQGCANCSYPTGLATNYCFAINIPCNTPTNTTAAPTPPCTGSCNWVWNSGSQCWTKAAPACVGALAPGSGGLIGNGCHGGSKCQCQPPTVDGNACEPNNVLTTYCQEAGTTTTSAPTPWMNCYTSSTTSTTTSTCGGSCGGCIWSYSTGAWVIYQNNCNAGCFCDQPTITGQATCQIQDTVCSTTTTTTTSTTTTTTTSTTTSSTTSTTSTTGWFCCGHLSGSNPGSVQCVLGGGPGPNYGCTGSFPYYVSGPYVNGSTCVTNCTITTTTTTSSTTTTTTTTVIWACCAQSQGGCNSGDASFGCYSSHSPDQNNAALICNGNGLVACGACSPCTSSADCASKCTTTTTSTTTTTTTSSTTTTTTTTASGLWWCCIGGSCAQGPNQSTACGGNGCSFNTSSFATQVDCLAACAAC